MTDLRSTGQIEQDADFIALLHREDFYHIKEGGYRMNHTAEVSIVKARDGERGQVVYLGCEMRYQRFSDIQQPDQPGQEYVP
jgi:replicative DNA helicase